MEKSQISDIGNISSKEYMGIDYGQGIDKTIIALNLKYIQQLKKESEKQLQEIYNLKIDSEQNKYHEYFLKGKLNIIDTILKKL